MEIFPEIDGVPAPAPGRIVRLLVVDDEELSRVIIREGFEIKGFLVDDANNGKQALAMMGQEDYSVLLTDIRMPGMDGIALLREVSRRFPDTARIVMTAHGELDTAVIALKTGAFDYILKPVNFDVLSITIRNALQKHEMERQIQDYRMNREAKVMEQTGLINSMYVRSIQSLIKALEAKDLYTRGHSQRVTRFSVAVGKELAMPPDRLQDLHRAAILHDLGKIGVRESILHKPGKLTYEEFGEVARHPESTTRILASIPFFQNVLPAILHHHERFDGRGYPGMIGGTDIPLESRIISVADTYDAMTSTRAFRPAHPATEAVAEIRRCSGTQFDPDIVSVFLSVKDTIRDEDDPFAVGWLDGKLSGENRRRLPG